MAEEQVRFGIVGVGGMGSGHVGMLARIAETRVTAVCDVDAEALKKATDKSGARGFASHAELLDSGLVDAIIIATPHYFHPPIAIDAFQRGIHVLSEKPLGVTVRSVDGMIEAARKSGCRFGVMFQMRAEPQNQAARQIVQSGALGNIYRTSLTMGWYRTQAYYNSGGWRATWAGEGGGVLINQAPHLLDLFTWLAGLPVEVTGTTRTRLHDIEVEDEAFATLAYANGAHGYLYASTTEQPGHQLLEICGDQGKLLIHGSKLQHWRVNPPLSRYTRESTEMWSSPEVQEVPIDMPPAPEPGGHSAITQNFARCILQGDALISPGEEGLNAVEMINAIILSSKNGRPQPVPVDRDAYEGLIQELKESSRAKAGVAEQRITDPNFA